MENNVDPVQTAENDNATDDQNAENGKWCRPCSDWKWQTVKTHFRLLRMANSVDPDQTAEVGQTV